jgi:hypothetical protein
VKQKHDPGLRYSNKTVVLWFEDKKLMNFSQNSIFTQQTVKISATAASAVQKKGTWFVKTLNIKYVFSKRFKKVKAFRFIRNIFFKEI